MLSAPSRRRVFRIAVLLMVCVVCYLAWPLYQFFAHKGPLPLPPWGYVALPAEAPAEQKLYQQDYQAAAAQALRLLENHRRSIHAPALSAAIAIDGELVWAGAVGWADIESGRAASPQTRFRIGSTSKAVTATGLARMVDAGLIDIDATVDRYWPNPPNEQWQGVKVRQLASHLAGLPDYQDNRDWLGLYRSMALASHYDDVEEASGMFDASPLLHEPGAAFHYTSYSTVLLSAVMQRAAAKPWLQLMAERVFGPLNLHSIVPDPMAFGTDRENLATFYWHDREFADQLRPWRAVDLSHRLAGGGLVSTSSDLARLGSAWLDEAFISAATRERFWTAQKLNNGAVNEQNYALGWRLYEGEKSPRNFNHGGVSRGAMSWLMVLPQYNMVVAVNSNARAREFWDFGSVSVELVKLFRPEE